MYYPEIYSSVDKTSGDIEHKTKWLGPKTSYSMVCVYRQVKVEPDEETGRQQTSAQYTEVLTQVSHRSHPSPQPGQS
jgi:hypothetical protein